jgi:hypothetical protein
VRRTHGRGAGHGGSGRAMKQILCAVLLVLMVCGCASMAPAPSGTAASPSSASPSSKLLPAPLPQAPVPPMLPGTVFRFTVHGDTRTGHAVHQGIVEAMVASRPALVLQTGDLVGDSSVGGEWSLFDTITEKMRATIPFYPARGSHDNQGGGFYEEHLPKAGIRRENFYYSFDKGRIHFVAIDTEDPMPRTGPQYLWLEADMKRARAEGRFIIPFFHKAIFSIGPHAGQADVVALRPVLHDLFLRNDVRLVFQGHDHLYYRSFRDGITYVVTGGGGAPLYGARHPELRVSGDVFESVHHFCIVDVYPDSVVVTAYRLDLSQLDSFTVPIPSS